MSLREFVADFLKAVEVHEAAEQAVVREMKRLGVDQVMVPRLGIIVHMDDLETDPCIWTERGVAVED